MGGGAGHAWLAELVRDVADFPKVGVGFKDITPLLADPMAFATAIDALALVGRELAGGHDIDRVVGIEARGFILAAPVAYRLGAGFVPVRKTGKLPWRTEQEAYELEYGTDLLEVHADAVRPGERVLIADDVIATGGTAAAAARLIEKLGATVVGFAFLIDLAFLGGRSQISAYPSQSLLTY